MSNASESLLLDSSGKIYPRSISGRYSRIRWLIVALTQLVFYGLPWLTWNARPAVLFDLTARQFYIFGVVLYPQDFIYLTFLLIISALSTRQKKTDHQERKTRPVVAVQFLDGLNLRRILYTDR